MSDFALSSPRAASPFSRKGILAVVLVGFVSFLAMLYFIGAGDTGDDGSAATGHANNDGLHGFSALGPLLEANGYGVQLSRGRDGLETTQLLVLTPPPDADPDDLAEIFEKRQYLGPTIVILPKWMTTRARGNMSEADEERIRRDWVRLIGAATPPFPEQLPEPFALELGLETNETSPPARWAGLELSGSLPSQSVLYANPDPEHRALTIDPSGRALALEVTGEEGSDYNENAHWVTFIVEPDLINNYGLADPARARMALALFDEAGYGERGVIFDMSLVGLGGSANLLTLAFQPPFLAATLCLILALFIVGWRAFLRFGPAAANGQATAFGKAQLVRNGAGLIVRARRLRLLADPYIALIERRLGRALGLARPDAASIDQALSIRLPDEEPFSHRAAALHNAARASEVLRAAQRLDELVRKSTGTKQV